MLRYAPYNRTADLCVNIANNSLNHCDNVCSCIDTVETIGLNVNAMVEAIVGNVTIYERLKFDLSRYNCLSISSLRVVVSNDVRRYNYSGSANSRKSVKEIPFYSSRNSLRTQFFRTDYLFCLISFEGGNLGV